MGSSGIRLPRRLVGKSWSRCQETQSMSEHASTITPKVAAPAAAETDAASPPAPPPPAIKRHRGRLWVWTLVGLLVLGGLGYYYAPSVIRAFITISTDDAYVNGHVTFVAPRVAGQV